MNGPFTTLAAEPRVVLPSILCIRATDATLQWEEELQEQITYSSSYIVSLTEQIELTFSFEKNLPLAASKDRESFTLMGRLD